MATVVVIALGDRRAGGVWGRAGAVRSRGADGGREGQGRGDRAGERALVGVSIGVERRYQQNDSLADDRVGARTSLRGDAGALPESHGHKSRPSMPVGCMGSASSGPVHVHTVAVAVRASARRACRPGSAEC